MKEIQVEDIMDVFIAVCSRVDVPSLKFIIVLGADKKFLKAFVFESYVMAHSEVKSHKILGWDVTRFVEGLSAENATLRSVNNMENFTKSTKKISFTFSESFSLIVITD